MNSYPCSAPPLASIGCWTLSSTVPMKTVDDYPPYNFVKTGADAYRVG